ncbi:RlmE family RNA methyltransferase [Lyticum sinuosum]|uniref:Ribosomal RNA large subunit methyltransferase E n=1 Tax=Lyticum sinuosum TaxID=1332059 RepID=A0AAE4VK97_9RICK|nr:RlmE family RNA methyltransferase [Lyticum sinuosum]MDZ5761511.1 Ribosomal RNA large subunit methyltransferase E [Lyticum sinuosum]
MIPNKIKSVIYNKSRIKVKINKKCGISSQQWLKRHLNDPYVAAAKEDGYRSRAAYKLLEIERKYKIIANSPVRSSIIDLGCAPGSWLQILSYLLYDQYNNINNVNNESHSKDSLKSFNIDELDDISKIMLSINKTSDIIFKYPTKMDEKKKIDKKYFNKKLNIKLFIPEGKKIYQKHKNREIIGLDKQKIDFVPNTKIITGDFTNSNTISDILKVISQKIGLILSDMAPSSSGNKDLDQATMNIILNDVFCFAKQNMIPTGNLLCKLLNNKETNEIIKQAENIFSRVKIFKPESSYKNSAEIFLICINKK